MIFFSGFFLGLAAGIIVGYEWRSRKIVRQIARYYNERVIGVN